MFKLQVLSTIAMLWFALLLKEHASFEMLWEIAFCVWAITFLVAVTNGIKITISAVRGYFREIEEIKSRVDTY